VLSFEPQIDKENGSALGIVFIRYATHDEAKRCATKENGRRLTAGVGLGLGPGLGLGTGEGEELRVVFDGEGKKLKAVLKELGERRKRDREEKKKREKEKEAKVKEATLKEANASLNPKAGSSTSTPTANIVNNGQPFMNSWKPGQPQPDRHIHPLPSNPNTHSDAVSAPTPAQPIPTHSRMRRPPAALVRARILVAAVPDSAHSQSPRVSGVHPAQASPLSSSTPMHPRPRGRLPSHYALQHEPSPMVFSRSPSPISRRTSGSESQSAKQKVHEGVLAELARNGMDHVRIELGGAVREEDVRLFFEGFKVQKVRASAVYAFFRPLPILTCLDWCLTDFA
jgi:histone-lysine N-methyltransferase SETD1